MDSGGLDRSAPGAPLPTGGRALGMRVARMLGSHPETNQPFELLLIDSGARFLFDPLRPDLGFSALDPKQKPAPPPLRWITNLDVFHALLKEHIAIDTAIVRGILVIEPVVADDPLFDGYGLPGDSTDNSVTAGDQLAVDPGRSATIILLLVMAALIVLPITLVLRSNRNRRTGALKAS